MELETLKIFRKYCRAISDKPEIFDRLKEELPAAILLDYERLMHEPGEHKKQIANDKQQVRWSEIMRPDEFDNYREWYEKQYNTKDTVFNYKDIIEFKKQCTT
jgi:hypothetical protein